jgi:putative protein-disulfide isomerase
MRLTYLFDPLCGWCYGAGPALEQLSQLDNLALELAPVGLFAGEGARPMDASFAAYAWQNDQRIARLTGQPFTAAYRHQVLAAAGTLFDSAPATLGLVAVGLAAPGAELRALRVLQRARYVDGRNTSELQVVSDVLREAEFTEAARRVASPDGDLLAAYRQRLGTARADMSQFGAEGVPALVIGGESERRLLHADALFAGFEQLTARLQAA